MWSKVGGSRGSLGPMSFLVDPSRYVAGLPRSCALIIFPVLPGHPRDCRMAMLEAYVHKLIVRLPDRHQALPLN